MHSARVNIFAKSWSDCLSPDGFQKSSVNIPIYSSAKCQLIELHNIHPTEWLLIVQKTGTTFTFIMIDPKCHHFPFGRSDCHRIDRNEMVKSRCESHIRRALSLKYVFVSVERGVNSKCNQITLPMTSMKKGDINFYNLSVSDIWHLASIGWYSLKK